MTKQVFNLQSALERVEGDRQFLSELIELFKSTYKKQLLELETACIEADFTKVSQIAHAIKGALLNLGAEKAAEAALTIEKEAKEGKCEKVSLLKDAVEEFFTEANGFNLGK